MALASDLNNPEFIGARDPDSGLYVEFYWHEPVDGWASAEKSREQQRRVVVKLPKQPFIRIMVPGDKNTIFEASVTEAHKQRFPRQWMAWQIAEGLVGGEEDIPGWKISEWPEIEPEMARDLLYMRFQTVEQLAGATDRQIQNIGIGGVGLREKARVALRNKMGADTQEALAKVEAEKKAMEERLARLEKMLEERGAAAPETPTEPEKKRRGRPPATEAKPEVPAAADI